MHGLAFVASRGALVVKEINIDVNSDNPIHIVARKAGVMSWLLSLIGVDPTTVFDVYLNRVEYSEGSLSGKVKHMIPLKSICNLGTGFFKPVLCFVFAVLCFIGAISVLGARNSGPVVLILLLIAVVFVIAYFLKRTLLIFALPASGVGPVFCIKRSVIEGVVIDEKVADTIIDIMTQLIANS